MLVNSILFLRRFFDNNLIKLVALWLIAIIIDNYYVINLDSPPDWDQGYHLSNTFKMFNIIDNHYLNIHEKFSNILDVTDSYRGPLTYFLSSLILKINNSYKFAYLSNHVFVLITILSIYKLGEIYKSTNVGLWASCIYLFSPLVIIQRGQYLIDISLTSFITLSTLVLTYWFKSKNNNTIFAMLSDLFRFNILS